MVDSYPEFSAARSQRQELRAQRNARQLHSLGARAIYELLAEISRRLDADDIVFGLLERYAERLTPDLLRSVGGDRFPPLPIRRIA